jgi:pilus assembly protein CpaC
MLTHTGRPSGASVAAPDQSLTLEVKQGRLIRLSRPAAGVFVADPQVADVQAHSPTLVYVFGRRSGTTSLFAVDEAEEVLFQRDIVVEHHLIPAR